MNVFGSPSWPNDVTGFGAADEVNSTAVMSSPCIHHIRYSKPRYTHGCSHGSCGGVEMLGRSAGSELGDGGQIPGGTGPAGWATAYGSGSTTCGGCPSGVRYCPRAGAEAATTTTRATPVYHFLMVLPPCRLLVP